MSDYNKPKAQLIEELALLRQRVVELEGLVETFSVGATFVPAELRSNHSPDVPTGTTDSFIKKLNK